MLCELCCWIRSFPVCPFLLAMQKKSDDMSMMQRANSAGSERMGEGGSEMRTGSLDSSTGAGMMTKRMSNKSDDKWPSFDTADIHKVWKTLSDN
jgi:hypothetical protein